MLIDEFLPEFEESKSYSISIPAQPNDVYQTLKSANFADLWVVRILFGIRSLPAILSGKLIKSTGKVATIADITRSGFMLLGENPDHELVIGVVGKFWKMSGNVKHDIQPAQFRSFAQPGFSKAVWNFSLEPTGKNMTRLSTETRIHCTDSDSRKKFKRYWTVIAPFSGWIRIEMLRALKKQAMKK